MELGEKILTFPWGKVPPQRRKRGGTESDSIPPHTRQGFALPPSPRRGFGSPKKYVVKFFSFCYNKSIYIKFFFYPMEEPE